MADTESAETFEALRAGKLVEGGYRILNKGLLSGTVETRAVDALKEFEHAARLNPDSGSPPMSRGFALYYQAEAARDVADTESAETLYREALGAFEEAIARNPRLGAAWYGRGSVLAVFGDLPGALACYKEALGRVAERPNAVAIGVIIIALNDIINNIHSIYESKNEEYTKDTMPDFLPDLETTLRAAAHHFGKPVETVHAHLAQLVVGEAAQATAIPAKATRPGTADAASAEVLQWPTAKWKDAPEKVLGKKLGIITFLKREWEPFIQKTGQVVTREVLATHDADAELALTRHLETHDFPKGLSIIYPRQLAKQLVRDRPDLVRAALGS